MVDIFQQIKTRFNHLHWMADNANNEMGYGGEHPLSYATKEIWQSVEWLRQLITENLNGFSDVEKRVILSELYDFYGGESDFFDDVDFFMAMRKLLFPRSWFTNREPSIPRTFWQWLLA